MEGINPFQNPQNTAKAMSRYLNLKRATRRIFFIQQEYSEDPDHFKDEYFGGFGTGILIKYKMNYFLLTTRHTLKHQINKSGERDVNTSPFWVTARGNHDFKVLADFLYPKYFIEIADLIDEHEYYDYQDVILVELFNPMADQKITDFIDLNKIDALEISEIKEGMYVADIGFIESFNQIFYDPDNEVRGFDPTLHTSSTVVNRNEVVGLIEKNKFVHVLRKFNHLDDNTNGMSGGLIIGVHKDKYKCIGMHIRGDESSEYINFLPIGEIFKAIKKSDTAERFIIDHRFESRVLSEARSDYMDYAFSAWLEKKRLSFDSLTPVQLHKQRVQFERENMEATLVGMVDRARILNKEQNNNETA